MLRKIFPYDTEKKIKGEQIIRPVLFLIFRIFNLYDFKSISNLKWIIRIVVIRESPIATIINKLTAILTVLIFHYDFTHVLTFRLVLCLSYIIPKIFRV